MSKRLLFSDIHFHPWNYGASVKDGFNTRLLAQRQTAQAMIKDAVEQNIKYAYFCGDLFHEHGKVATQALASAASMFGVMREFGIKIRAIPGNHDIATREGWPHSLAWLPQEEICGQWEDDGLLVQALPYTESQELLDEFLAEAGRLGGMAMLHQGVAGVPLSSGYVLDEKLTPQMIPSNVRAFTGHYHFHRAVSPNLTVVGNLSTLTWGDIDQPKGWVIWDDSTGALEQRVQHQSPGFMSFQEGMDVELVQGQFVRYTTPVESKDIEAVRAGLIKEGALTVEFPSVKIEVKQDKIRTGHDVIADHINAAQEGLTPRRQEVGVEVREARYDSSVHCRTV